MKRWQITENALHSCFTGTLDLAQDERDQNDGRHSAQQNVSRAVSLTVNRNDKFLVAAKQHLDIIETAETMEHLALGYCD